MAHIEPQRVNVGDEENRRGQRNAALHQPKLVRLLDRVDGVGAAIGYTDRLGFRALRCQQEGSEIAAVDRMPD